MELLKHYNKFCFKDKLLILKIFILSGIVRFIILTVPFKKISKYLGVPKEESSYIPNEDDINKIKRISYLVVKVCRKTPWESKCLVQAIIAQRLLIKENIESTLYLGVGKDNTNMVAHAWVKCGDLTVTGVIDKEFGVVAKYRK